MPRVCVICKRQQGPSLSVFRFPISMDQQASWVRVIRRVFPDFAKTENDMRNHMKNGLCEMHFNKSDITRGKQKCRLKKDAIPLTSTLETSFAVMESPNEIPLRDKYTQTENRPDGLREIPKLEQLTVPDDFPISQAATIKACAVCRDTDTYYGHRLSDCDKSVLQIVSEICLLDQASFGAEICIRCVNVIREIVQLKREIKRRMQLLINMTSDIILEYDGGSGRSPVEFAASSGKFIPTTKKIVPDGDLRNHFSCERANKKHTYNCTVCLKLFYTRHLHLLHEADHNRCFDCVICGRFLTTHARLRGHLLKFHGLGEAKRPTNACPYCERSFGTLAGLRYHVTVSHVDSVCYRCDKCGKTFKSKLLHKSHLLFSHGQRTVSCDFCARKFFTASKRNTHVNTVHRKAASWLCRACDLKFTSNTTYRHHLRSKHRKGTFPCGKCASVFRKKSVLREHMSKHDVAACPACDITFTDQRTYHLHVPYCRKIKDEVSRSPKFDSTLPLFRDENYTQNDSNVLPIESIKLIGLMDKSDTSDANLSSEIPLVNVHLLDEMDVSQGGPMNHTIEPLCHDNLFESGLSPEMGDNVGSNIHCLPLHHPVDKIHQDVDKMHSLTLQPDAGNELNLDMIENHDSKLNSFPLHQPEEQNEMAILDGQNVPNDLIPGALRHADQIGFPELHFNPADTTSEVLPLSQVVEVEIPSIPLEEAAQMPLTLDASDSNRVMHGLPLPPNGDDVMGDLPFADYHDRSMPLDHKPFETNVLTDHLVHMETESGICGALGRDKDWNLSLVLDNTVPSIAFGSENIQASIDLPLEQNVLVDGHVPLDAELPDYTLPSEHPESTQYVMYLDHSDSDVK